MSNTSINVSFMKRVTTGPYEHEEMKVEFSVPSSDLLESVTAERKDFVYRTLGKPTTATNFIPTIKPEATTSLKGEKHDNSEENSEKSNEASNKKSSSKGEKSSSEKASSKKSVNTAEVEAPEKVAEPSKTEEKSAKTKKSDVILYDRENPDHRSTMSNYLTKLTGGKDWAKDKEKSKAASAALSGQPFMDKSGEILESFQTMCQEKFGISSDDL